MKEIKSTRLGALDRKVAEFYGLSFRYFSNPANLHGRNMYKAELKEILKETDKVTISGTFDALVLSNIQSNLKINDLVVDYITDPGFSLAVPEFFDRIVGKGAWVYLENLVARKDWKREWDFSEKSMKKSFARLTKKERGAKEAAAEHQEQIRKDVLEYGKSKGYLPADFNFRLILTSGVSGWSRHNQEFHLGYDTFDYLPGEKDSLKAAPIRAYQVAFHEILGHAAHQEHSFRLPLTLQMLTEGICLTPTKSVTEGLAIDRENQSYEFLRQAGFSEEDIQLLEDSSYLSRNAEKEHLYSAMIKDRELREEGFDGYKHMLDITNNPVMAEYFKHRYKGSFLESWQGIGHVLGSRHYQMMVDKVKQEFGDDFIEKNPKAFNEASMKGVWSWQVYPEAVCYFLKKMKKE